MHNVITDTESREIISDNLRRLLEEAGMSQGDLARELQLEDSTLQSWRMRISRWCNGETLPSPADLVNLAEVFEVKIEELLLPEKSSKRR
jgi:transcriptional regulator with XRE-family HTH domain